VLGILALLISWIPLLGLLAWPLGGIGLLLGIVGIVLAARREPRGSTSAIAGTALNGAAIVVSLVVTTLAGGALQSSLQQAQEELARGAKETGKERDTPPPSPPPAARREPAPSPAAPDGTFAGQDRNGDGRLNADELPDRLKSRFATIDTDGDGYVNRSEWDLAAQPATPESPRRGKVIARFLYTAADDFVVDIWHDGKKVPDHRREMVGENYGATAEKINVEVREGDWLVFNVVNNRLRWGGAYYFAAAGIGDGEPQVPFTTDPNGGRWSYGDDPGQVPAFIAHPRYHADQAALPPTNPWGGGDGEMKARVPEWNGKPVWGKERTTWIKYVAPDPSGTAETEPEKMSPARSDATSPEDNEVRKPRSKAPALKLTKRATLTGHPALVYCVAVTPDGTRVVSGSAPKFDIGRPDVDTVIAWSLADGGRTHVVIPIKQTVPSLALTPDGRTVAAPYDNRLGLFDLATGRALASLSGPARTNSMSVAISPDGKVAAAGFTTREIVLWNLATRKPIRTLRGHTGGVNSLAFSPDGRQLASGSQDNTIRLWEVASGKSRQTLKPERANARTRR
jgi:WD40 repeat protein